MVYPTRRPGVKKNKIKSRITKHFPQFLYKWWAFLPIMTRRWAMVLWRVPPGGWTMAWHSVAWRWLVAWRGRSSVMVGWRISAPGSGARAWPTPVGSAPFLIDTDVSSLTLPKEKKKHDICFFNYLKGKRLNLIITGAHLMRTELSPIQSA